MRKVTVLLAMVAVVVLTAASAYGFTYNTFKGGSIGTDEGDFHTTADWGLWETVPPNGPGWVGAGHVPVAGEKISVRGDTTCHIWADIISGSFKLGYHTPATQSRGGYGNVIVESKPGEPFYAPIIDTTAADKAIWLGVVTWWHDGVGGTFEPSTWTQKCGSVTTPELSVGVGQIGSDLGPSGYPDDCGYGKYVISGGTLTDTCYGIYVGWRDAGQPSIEGRAKGTFRIVGDDAVISAKRYIQNDISTLEVVLTSDGTVTPINCAPHHPLYKNSVLKGTLDLDASADTPTIGDKITILEILNGYGTETPADLLDYSELTLIGASALDRTINPSINQGYRLTDNGNGAMQVLYTSLGDADLDADVDAADYGAWQSGFGATTGGTWETGDFDGDGDVDAADYGMWQANFGTTPPSGAVPEPITLTLLGLGGLALLKRRRQ